MVKLANGLSEWHKLLVRKEPSKDDLISLEFTIFDELNTYKNSWKPFDTFKANLSMLTVY